MNSFNKKFFLHPTRSSWECYHLKWEISKGWKMISWTSNCEDFHSRQSAFRISRPEVLCKKVVLNNFENIRKTSVPGSTLNKVASWTLLKIDSGTHFCFLNVLQHFEKHLFCRTLTHGHFWTFLKPRDTMIQQEFLWLIFTFLKENYWKKN